MRIILILILLFCTPVLAEDCDREDNLEGSVYEKRYKDTEYGRVYKDPNDQYWEDRKKEREAYKREKRKDDYNFYDRRASDLKIFNSGKLVWENE
jgi:hypothetical protein